MTESRTVPSVTKEQRGSGKDTVDAAHNHEARLSRVFDYQAKSLAKEDDLEANLGSINSGLMRIAIWLDEAVDQVLESGPRTVERLTRLLPAIDAHLRVTRQVDRFAQLEIRAVESRKPRMRSNAGDSLHTLNAPSLPLSQSEET